MGAHPVSRRAVFEKLASEPMSSKDIAWIIRFLIRILQQQGVTLRDFDDKERSLHSLKFYGEKKAYLIFSREETRK